MRATADMVCYTLVLLVALLGKVAAHASPYNLHALVAHALEEGVDIGERQWGIKTAEADLQKAKAARFLPRLRLKSTSGLVPEAKGDIFTFNSDTTGIRPLGPFTRTEIEFIQPLYVFGATSLRRAAEKGVEVKQADLEAQRLNLATEVKELYYSVLLTQDLDALAGRLTKQLDKRREELDSSTLSLSNYYKLQLAVLELEKQQLVVKTNLTLARDALKWKAGLAQEDSLNLADKSLKPREFEMPPLEKLIKTAVNKRPDWRKLQAGLQAKKALVEAAKGAYYPQFLLAGGLRHAVAPNRTDQHNPFVKDEFNLLTFGAVLQVRQSFEWGLLGADLAKRKSAYLELKAKEKDNHQGLRLDIRRACAGVEEARASLDQTHKARQLSRQWLKEAQEAYDFDPEEVKELVSGFEAWAAAEQSYTQAVFDYNMSLAKLERTTGLVWLGEEP